MKRFRQTEVTFDLLVAYKGTYCLCLRSEESNTSTHVLLTRSCCWNCYKNTGIVFPRQFGGRLTQARPYHIPGIKCGVTHSVISDALELKYHPTSFTIGG